MRRVNGGYALHWAEAAGHKYNFTDWGHELRSLGGHEKPSRVKITEQKRSGGGWWSQTDSGQNLIQAAGHQEIEEDAAARKKGSSFTPQCLTPSSVFVTSPRPKARSPKVEEVEEVEQVGDVGQ
eukprot:gene3428-13472_t